jgi:hypothetical protein
MLPSRAVAAVLLQRTVRAYWLYAASVLVLGVFAPRLALSLAFYPAVAFGMVAYVHGRLWFGAEREPTPPQRRAVRRQVRVRQRLQRIGRKAVQAPAVRAAADRSDATD